MADQVQEREILCLEIKRAFERAGVGASFQNFPTVPYAVVMAYVNHRSGWHTMGPGWLRQIHAYLHDGADRVKVYMSGLYRIPEGKNGRDILIDQLPILFEMSQSESGWQEEIVSRSRQASLEHSEMTEVRVSQPSPPPVALDTLVTLADLIEVHERFYPTDQYHAWLRQILAKLGKVHYQREEWFIDVAGHLCHTETATGSPRLIGSDGEEVMYTNAEYIKLDAYRDLCEA